MKIEEISGSVASLAEKLSRYHSRLLELEREIKHLKEVKDVEVKPEEQGKRISET